MSTPAASGHPRVTMFVSTGDNIGQTTTVINVALALGGRVLVVHAPTGRSGVLEHLLALGDRPDPRRPVTLRYAGERERADLVAVDGPAGLAALHRDTGPDGRPPLFTGYDHVLIDGPPPDLGKETAAPVPPCDRLAVCFPLTSWSIDHAAELARGIRARLAAGPPVLAVGLKADTRMLDQLRTARTRVRTAFRDVTGGAEAHYVEIPYDPAYAHQELSIAAGPPGAHSDLGHAYALLARELGSGRPTTVEQVTVVTAERNRPWAEWAAAELGRSGVRTDVVPLGGLVGGRPEPGSALLVVSPAGIPPEEAAALGGLSHPDIRLLVVDDLVLPSQLAHHERIDLRGLSAGEAAERLHRALRLPVPAGPAAGRFPRPPEQTTLPPRDGGFVGRDELLAELRARLAAAGEAGEVCLLEGEPGAGKSEIALEYCHRYGGDYDAIWWLPADSPRRLRRGLADLAARLGVPAVGDVAAAVVRRLGEADRERVLVVYDGAPAAGEITPFVPPAAEHCHVLVTSRHADALETGRRLLVPPFSPAESRALLAARVGGLTAEQAESVAGAVQHVPLVVGLAAAWLKLRVARGLTDNLLPPVAVRGAVEDFGDELRSVRRRLQSGRGRVPHALAMLEMLLEELPRDPGVKVWEREPPGRHAVVWLLQACAILTEEEVGLGLLRSPAMVAALARHGGRQDPAAGNTPDPDAWLSDPLLVDVALHSLARHGLIEVDLEQPAQPVRQHRVLRELIMERMGPERLRARTAQVRAVLAEYSLGASPAGRPGTADGDLIRHFVELELWAAPERRTRYALLRQLQALTQTGDRVALEQVIEIAALAERAWHDDDLQGAGGVEYLRLLNFVSRAHRLLGDYAESSRCARRALREQRRVLGVDNPRTLLSGDVYGAVLHAVGEFEDACSEGRHVVERMSEILGPHHEATMQAEHNLALSEALMGRAETALRTLRARFTRGRVVGGVSRTMAWRVVDALAYCHRELGQYRESFDLLKEFLGNAAQLGVPRSQRMAAEIGLAVTERRLGFLDGACERNRRLLEEYTAAMGEAHLGTLRCRFGLAVDLFELGKHEDARQEAEHSVRGLERTLGPHHPYTLIGRVRLAACHRVLGRPEQALEIAHHSARTLAEELGQTHPWTLAAQVGLANALVATGEVDQAAVLERAVEGGYEERRMTYHPHRLAVGRNLADTLRRRSTPEGRERPDTARRAEIDLEIPGL